MSKEIFRFLSEDDGTRHYTDDGYVLCNKCRARMLFMEDMDEMVSYYLCPLCNFIEIDEYYEDELDEDYDLLWPDSYDEDDDD